MQILVGLRGTAANKPRRLRQPSPRLHRNGCSKAVAAVGGLQADPPHTLAPIVSSPNDCGLSELEEGVDNENLTHRS